MMEPLTTKSIISIVSSASGLVGSVLLAFSFGKVITALHLADQAMQTTMEMVVHESRDVVIFKGLDEQLKRATASSSRLTWAGVGLLVVAFGLQLLVTAYYR